MGAETVNPKLKESLSDRALAALEKAVELLDYAGNVSRSGLAGLADKDGSAMDWMDEAARGKRHTSSTNLKDATTKRLLGDGHMRFGVDGDGETTIGDIADVGLDTLIDVGTDPLTLLGAGLLKGGKLPKVLHAGEAGMAGSKGGKNILKETANVLANGAGNLPDGMTPEAAKALAGAIKAGPVETIDLTGKVVKSMDAPAKAGKAASVAEKVASAPVDAGEALAKKVETLSPKAKQSLAALEKNGVSMVDDFQGFPGVEAVEEVVAAAKPKSGNLLTNNPITSILTAGGLGTGAYNHVTKPRTDGFRTSPRGKVKASKGDGGKEMPVLTEADIKIVKKLSPALAKELEASGAYNKDNVAAQEAAFKKVEPFIHSWTTL